MDDVVGYNDDNVVAIIYAVAYDHIDGNECLWWIGFMLRLMVLISTLELNVDKYVDDKSDDDVVGVVNINYSCFVMNKKQ